eukprot:scpid60588/ scgid29543/ 
MKTVVALRSCRSIATKCNILLPRVLLIDRILMLATMYALVLCFIYLPLGIIAVVIPRDVNNWDLVSQESNGDIPNHFQFPRTRRVNTVPGDHASFLQHSGAKWNSGRVLPSPPQTPNGTYALNVRRFGAKGDGKGDDTAAFQKALDQSYKLGSLFVLAPPGQYVIRANLTIPVGVTLKGSYMYAPSHVVNRNPPHDPPSEGSVLLAYGGRNVSSGCLITVSELATFSGFTVYYPDQVQDKAPVPYPWSVCLDGINTAVTDVECLNCWNAVKAVKAPRHYIARIQGQPINMGVYVDENHDVGRIEDVHFVPWYSKNLTYIQWQFVNGQAFVFGHTNWQYVFNTFAFGYAVGYRFLDAETGACNGNFLGIGADMMANSSVLVDNVKPDGIHITNGEFTAFRKYTWGKQIADPTQIHIRGTNRGGVRISNSAFWGPSDQIAIVAGSGTTGFMGCTFVNWDAYNIRTPAIYVIGATGNLIVEGCDFAKKGNPPVHIILDTTLARAIITGNTFATRLWMYGSAHNTQIGLNADDSENKTLPNDQP